MHSPQVRERRRAAKADALAAPKNKAKARYRGSQAVPNVFIR
jgi:hypothetical protein